MGEQSNVIDHIKYLISKGQYKKDRDGNYIFRTFTGRSVISNEMFEELERNK